MFYGVRHISILRFLNYDMWDPLKVVTVIKFCIFISFKLGKRQFYVNISENGTIDKII